MKTNVEKTVLNNALKEEFSSFGQLIKVMNVKKESDEMKNFLSVNDLTFEQLTDKSYISKGLKMSEFTNKNGERFTTISRKDKEGNTVIAKWSFWLILSAAIKVRKNELKELEKEAKKQKSIELMKIKEVSRKELEKEEKKATKKTTKKVAEKEVAKKAA